MIIIESWKESPCVFSFFLLLFIHGAQYPSTVVKSLTIISCQIKYIYITMKKRKYFLFHCPQSTGKTKANGKKRKYFLFFIVKAQIGVISYYIYQNFFQWEKNIKSEINGNVKFFQRVVNTCKKRTLSFHCPVGASKNNVVQGRTLYCMLCKNHNIFFT